MSGRELGGSMNLICVRFFTFIVVLLVGGFAPAVAQENYPTRTIRLVVPVPPGGVLDILARLLVSRLSDGLKQSIAVDNRAGANGNIAVESVAKSQPDGLTILFGQVSNLTVNPAIYSQVPFDTLRDLAPIGLVASTTQLMAVSVNSPLRSVADMVGAAKARPNALTFASAGQGSLGHLAFELIQLSAGIKLVHIPYKGASPALIDLLGGRVDLIILAQPAMMGHIRNGKMRALAILTASRVPDLPNLPTLSESGFPGVMSSNWFALMVRAGTPEPIIARLNAELNRALADKELRAKYEQEGASPLGGTPQQLTEQLKADLAKWQRVVKEMGLKIE